MARKLTGREQRIGIHQVGYDIMKYASQDKLTTNDIETLSHLMDDLKNGRYVDTVQYNLSAEAIDFIADVMRKALCPDKQEK